MLPSMRLVVCRQYAFGSALDLWAFVRVEWRHEVQFDCQRSLAEQHDVFVDVFLLTLVVPHLLNAENVA